MNDNDVHDCTKEDKTTSSAARKIAIAEKARALRKEQYARAKERQQKYLKSPEMQAKLALQREKFKKIRGDRSAQLRAAKKAASRATKMELTKAGDDARMQRQTARDQELKEMIRPALTLIQGGLAE